MESNGIKSNIHHILHIRKCFKNSYKNPIFLNLSFFTYFTIYFLQSFFNKS